MTELRELIAKRCEAIWYGTDTSDTWDAISNFILNLVSEQVEKALLSDEELRVVCGWEDIAGIDDYERCIAKAQLDAVLKILKDN
jgi:hypothetical protein